MDSVYRGGVDGAIMAAWLRVSVLSKPPAAAAAVFDASARCARYLLTSSTTAAKRTSASAAAMNAETLELADAPEASSPVDASVPPNPGGGEGVAMVMGVVAIVVVSTAPGPTENDGEDVGWDVVGESVGDAVGRAVGDAVGDVVVGESVGETVGDADGDNVGDVVGVTVGDEVGDVVGDAVGDDVGDIVGEEVGEVVGDVVGESVGGNVHSGRSGVGESVIAVVPLPLPMLIPNVEPLPMFPMPGVWPLGVGSAEGCAVGDDDGAWVGGHMHNAVGAAVSGLPPLPMPADDADIPDDAEPPPPGVSVRPCRERGEEALAPPALGRASVRDAMAARTTHTTLAGVVCRAMIGTKSSSGLCRLCEDDATCAGVCGM